MAESTAAPLPRRSRESIEGSAIEAAIRQLQQVQAVSRPPARGQSCRRYPNVVSLKENAAHFVPRVTPIPSSTCHAHSLFQQTSFFSPVDFSMMVSRPAIESCRCSGRKRRRRSPTRVDENDQQDEHVRRGVGWSSSRRDGGVEGESEPTGPTRQTDCKVSGRGKEERVRLCFGPKTVRCVVDRNPDRASRGTVRVVADREGGGQPEGLVCAP